MVLVGLLLKSIELLLKSTDSACCEYIYVNHARSAPGGSRPSGQAANKPFSGQGNLPA